MPAALFAAALAVGACGGTGSTTTDATTDTATATTTQTATTVPVIAEWAVRTLGPNGPDPLLTMVEHEGRVWLARRTDGTSPIVVTTVDTTNDAATTAELPFDRPIHSLRMTSTPVGVVLTVADVTDFVTHTRTSSDGVTWSEGVISDRPVDIYWASWVSDRLLATGAERIGANPSGGPFSPVLFESPDGLTWSEIDLGAELRAADSGMGSIEVDGDRLVSIVQLDGQTMVESLDGGSTWRLAPDSGVSPIQIATAGELLVGTGAFDPATATATPVSVHRDGAWEALDVSAVLGPISPSSAVVLESAPAGAVIEVRSEDFQELCFDQPDPCTTRWSNLLLVRPDGSASVVDTGRSDAVAIAASFADDGTLHLLLVDEDAAELRSWPGAAGPLPSLAPLPLLDPSDPPVVQWDATLTVGGIYRYAIFTHCGIESLGRFNDLNWWLVESTLSGPIGDRWLYGEIHLVADDRIEYVVDDETIAVYAPRADEPPMCA